MNTMTRFFCTVFALLVTMSVGASGLGKPLRVGWVVGDVVDDKAHTIGPSILHTRNGGRRWVTQVDPIDWPGYSPTDVSAVDRKTAWVALGGPLEDSAGALLHTQDGGRTWVEQTLPEGVAGGMKQIKGLSRREAWAVSLKGTVLHTTDGGEIWTIVEHPSVQGTLDVNRMDVIGCVDPHNAVRPGKSKLMSTANIWITDHLGGVGGGIIHSLNNGLFWRRESVPYTGTEDTSLHMLDAYSPRVAWAVLWHSNTLFRTDDGGETWEDVAEVPGINDIDDMCSPSADTLWAVQYQGIGGGVIYHVRLRDDGSSDVEKFDPVPGFAYEGLTCVDDQTALAVGYQAPGQPPGLIVSTTDGGQSWTQHSAPVDDVVLWKTSFVGARR